MEKDKWILVADPKVCDLSQKQINVCKDLKIPLKGAVLCDTPANEKTPVCHDIDFFPSFCHVDTNVCMESTGTCDDGTQKNVRRRCCK